MIDTVENLILDLVEWVARKKRTYRETMDAWRTSCPRLPVWEDATDRLRALSQGWFELHLRFEHYGPLLTVQHAKCEETPILR